MDKLGNLLPRVLAKQPGGRVVTELRVRLAFAELMGEKLAGACDEVSVRGGVLTIQTANPALAHQLRLDGDLLISKLNEMQLGRRLRSLKVRVGRGTAP